MNVFDTSTFKIGSTKWEYFGRESGGIWSSYSWRFASRSILLAFALLCNTAQLISVGCIFTNFLLDGLISIAQWEEIAEDQRVSRREGEAKVCPCLLIEVFGSCWMLP